MAVQRSKPYPAIGLEEAIKKVKEAVQKLGSAKKYNKATFAQGLGYKDATNGAFLRTSAALIQYNLVIRSGTEYSLTQLAEAILWPTNDEAAEQAVRDAALSPQVFGTIFQKYQGQELPGLLANILAADHGILVGAKDKVVGIFRATMEYAGLLRGNKLLDPNTPPTRPNSEPHEEESKNVPGDQLEEADATPHFTSSVATTTLIKDFGEGRVATLKIPTDLAEDEREKLANLIKKM